MINAQTQHDRLQKFIQAARRGRFDRSFTSADAHAFNLAEALIDHAQFIPIEIMAGACGFARIAQENHDTANMLLGRCQVQLPITPEKVQLSRSKKFPRSPK